MYIHRAAITCSCYESGAFRMGDPILYGYTRCPIAWVQDSVFISGDNTDPELLVAHWLKTSFVQLKTINNPFSKRGNVGSDVFSREIGVNISHSKYVFFY